MKPCMEKWSLLFRDHNGTMRQDGLDVDFQRVTNGAELRTPLTFKAR